jgi:hypothetical protein
MAYSLGQAAKACGRSKTTIHRAIASGRLSASRTDAGCYSIDPAELARAFPQNGSGSGTSERSAPGDANPGPDVVTLERLIAEQRETIRDLRTRLDASEEERRRAQERLAGVLADRRQSGTVPAVPLVTRPWWRRWLK